MCPDADQEVEIVVPTGACGNVTGMKHWFKQNFNQKIIVQKFLSLGITLLCVSLESNIVEYFKYTFVLTQMVECSPKHHS